jgi:pre-mRNA-splicing helicase BRR2
MLGDQPRDVICGAADEVLAVLKNDSYRDTERKKESESMLGAMTDDRFHQLLSLSKKITDYSADRDVAEDALDDEVGVAVDFGEDDDEEGDEFEIKENDSDDDDGEEAAADAELHGQGAEVAGEAEAQAKDTVDPRQIDAFWLQRELSKFYDDAVTSQQRALEVRLVYMAVVVWACSQLYLFVCVADWCEHGCMQVLEVLEKGTSERDIENKLALLLGYERFDFVKLLRKNRLLGMSPSPSKACLEGHHKC